MDFRIFTFVPCGWSFTQGVSNTKKNNLGVFYVCQESSFKAELR